VASATALEALRAAVASGQALDAAIVGANAAVFEKAATDRSLSGMGTTLTAVAILGESTLLIGNVGDSRAYRIRDAAIERLTRDHSLLEQFKEAYPEMTPEEERNFPHKNVITRALGLSESVEVDVQTHELRPGDLYLLCSDGLSGQVPDEEILEVMRDPRSLELSVAELVERANQQGGHDNITVVALAADPRPP
jgi:protein phosphatase